MGKRGNESRAKAEASTKAKLRAALQAGRAREALAKSMLKRAREQSSKRVAAINRARESTAKEQQSKKRGYEQSVKRKIKQQVEIAKRWKLPYQQLLRRGLGALIAAIRAAEGRHKSNARAAEQSGKRVRYNQQVARAREAASKQKQRESTSKARLRENQGKERSSKTREEQARKGAARRNALVAQARAREAGLKRTIAISRTREQASKRARSVAQANEQRIKAAQERVNKSENNAKRSSEQSRKNEANAKNRIRSAQAAESRDKKKAEQSSKSEQKSKAAQKAAVAQANEYRAKGRKKDQERARESAAKQQEHGAKSRSMEQNLKKQGSEHSAKSKQAQSQAAEQASKAQAANKKAAEQAQKANEEKGKRQASDRQEQASKDKANESQIKEAKAKSDSRTSAAAMARAQAEAREQQAKATEAHRQIGVAKQGEAKTKKDMEEEIKQVKAEHERQKQEAQQKAKEKEEANKRSEQEQKSADTELSQKKHVLMDKAAEPRALRFRLSEDFCMVGRPGVGERVFMRKCDGKIAQDWKLFPDNTVRLAQDSHFCLQTNGAVGEGGDVSIGRCEISGPKKNQLFKKLDDHTIRYMSNSKYCAGLAPGHLQAGGRIHLYQCEGVNKANTGWTAANSQTPSGAPKTVVIRQSLIRRLCITAPTRSFGAGLIINYCDGSGDQDFKFYIDGSIRLASDPRFCVENFQNNKANGNRIILNACAPTGAALGQQWKMKGDSTICQDGTWCIDLGDNHGPGARLLLIHYRGTARERVASQTWITADPKSTPKEPAAEIIRFKYSEDYCVTIAGEAPNDNPTGINVGDTISFESFGRRNEYMRHAGFRMQTSRISSVIEKKDSSFRVVRGLAGDGVSLQSLNYPNHYVRHSGGYIYIHEMPNQRDSRFRNFARDSTWLVRKGFSGGNNGYFSFEAYNNRGKYIMYLDRGQLRIDNRANSNSNYRNAASFRPRSAHYGGGSSGGDRRIVLARCGTGGVKTHRSASRSQLWRFYGDGSIRYANDPQFCIENKDDNVADNNPLVLTRCDRAQGGAFASDAMVWKWGGERLTLNFARSWCTSLSKATAEDGQNIVVKPCTQASQRRQLWVNTDPNAAPDLRAREEDEKYRLREEQKAKGVAAEAKKKVDDEAQAKRDEAQAKKNKLNEENQKRERQEQGYKKVVQARYEAVQKLLAKSREETEKSKRFEQATKAAARRREEADKAKEASWKQAEQDKKRAEQLAKEEQKAKEQAKKKADEQSKKKAEQEKKAEETAKRIAEERAKIEERRAKAEAAAKAKAKEEEEKAKEAMAKEQKAKRDEELAKKRAEEAKKAAERAAKKKAEEDKKAEEAMKEQEQKVKKKAEEHKKFLAEQEQKAKKAAEEAHKAYQLAARADKEIDIFVNRTVGHTKADINSKVFVEKVKNETAAKAEAAKKQMLKTQLNNGTSPINGTDSSAAGGSSNSTAASKSGDSDIEAMLNGKNNVIISNSNSMKHNGKDFSTDGSGTQTEGDCSGKPQSQCVQIHQKGDSKSIADAGADGKPIKVSLVNNNEMNVDHKHILTPFPEEKKNEKKKKEEELSQTGDQSKAPAEAHIESTGALKGDHVMT